jgi:hypothetical protein
VKRDRNEVFSAISRTDKEKYGFSYPYLAAVSKYLFHLKTNLYTLQFEREK